MEPIVRWFAEEWSKALSSALFAMTGEQSEACAGPLVDSPPDGIGWEESLSHAEGARMLVRLPDAVWKGVGGHILQAAGLPSDDEASARDAFLEVVRQSLSQVASKVGARLGADIELKNGHETTDTPASFHWQEVALAFGGALPPCAIGISKELINALAAHETQLAAAASASVGMAQQVTGNEECSITNAPATRNSKTLDLLLEVDMPVGISFGRTQMRLKEALRLTTGSIVELNRAVTEPVELIVNNCVIARGEVVVVEGNYGVRILEIISREERLRTLF